MLLTLHLEKKTPLYVENYFLWSSVYHRGIKHALSKTKHVNVFFCKDATEYAKRRSHVTLMK